MAKTQSAQVLEAYREVIAASAKGQQALLAPDQGSLYRDVMQESYKTILAMAPPLHLQAGFPVQRSEILARLERGPQDWAPELQSSNDDADEEPVKVQLSTWQEPRSWWNSYRSPVNVRSSDSSSSADNESSSEKEEEKNVKPEWVRITKPRAPLLGKCEVTQEGCEQLEHLQGSKRTPSSRTNKKDRSPVKSRKGKLGKDPGKNRYVCPQCGNSFNRKSSLKRHVTTIHDGSRPYEWPRHGKSSPEKSNRRTRARRHTKSSHSGREPYECPECGESFMTNSSFTKHRRTHTDETAYQCPGCEKSYVEERYLIKHLMTAHSGAHLSKCPDCGKGFLGEEDLSRHQTMIHGEESLHQRPDHGKYYQEKFSYIKHQRHNAKEVPFKCSECEKTFTDKKSLASHLRIHKREKPYLDKEVHFLTSPSHATREGVLTCPDCGMCFKAERCFLNHQRIHMEQKCSQPDKGDIFKGGTPFARSQEARLGIKCKVETTERKETLYTCPKCGKIFRDSRCFANHQSTHVKEEPSENVGAQEAVEEKTTGPQENHLKEKPFKCCSCGKTYATPYNLNRHQRIHADNRPYKCTICGKTFAYRYTLVHHEASHPEGKACQHKCSYCGKGFTTKTSLSRHLQLHVMGRPYQCNICGKAFAYRYSLSHHQEVHVQGQPQKCLFCWKVFRTSHSLSRHKRIHMETRSYQCSVCGKAFGTKYSFCRHQDMHLDKSLSYSSSRENGLTDDSILTKEEDSDTDENSNNWSDNSVHSGRSVKETPEECPKSVGGTLFSKRQNAQVEENPKGTPRNNSVPLQDQATCADKNVNNWSNNSACCEHQGVHMKELAADVSEMEDVDILTKPQSTPLKENTVKGLGGGETLRDHSVDTTSQDGCAEKDASEGTYNLVDPKQQGASMEGSLPESEKQGGFTDSLTQTKHQSIPIGVNSIPSLEGEESHKVSSTHSGLHRVLKGPKQRTCSNCGKSFRDKYSLTRHEKTHTLERPFPCSQCEKRFKTKSGLDKHQKTHDKSFCCSYCDKRVATSSILKNHLRTHTGEKPFKCTECGKDYRTKSSLSKHREGHFKAN